ncbi:Uncharacterised protein [Mycobacteroides abscessus subsp. abscessus]|uniref:hypothetical protein n=1 Tax=Mycobacteroides abscessus TaxID=36809 RepID=UPI0009287AA3|nr:hypothetical protein [Mycobacteroides abscessus]SHZ37959.1 Uncharacterised protein [Mycobacteroides abscessus subsp. abscessus]SHZ39861.1 Uncharacterised protein [Mycobacteroides abscessus subsp. abscessus]
MSRDWWNNPAPGDTAKAERLLDDRKCRYATKRLFPTRELAREGAQDIRTAVEAAGREYQTLYPYRCPDDAGHWHLSHYPQGYATCSLCRRRAAAWNGGKFWVMAAHTTNDEPCRGVGGMGSDGGDSR